METEEKVQVLIYRKATTVFDPELPGYQFLLLLTNQERGGFWQPVTGKVEPGDLNLEFSARRELKEETGISTTEDFSKMDPCVFEFTKKETRFREHIFAVAVVEGARVLLSGEHQDSRWCSYSEAQSLIEYDSNRFCLSRLAERLAGKPIASRGSLEPSSDTDNVKSSSLLVPNRKEGTRLNLPLVALSFSILLILGLGMSFLEEDADTRFSGDIIIDFNGQESAYLSSNYDLSLGFNIYLWEEQNGEWLVQNVTREEANAQCDLELSSPQGDYHTVFIFKDLERDNATVFSLLEELAEIEGFSLESSYSGILDATRVTGIAGVSDGEDGSYWQYWVDDDYATVGADNNKPEGEHTVSWKIN